MKLATDSKYVCWLLLSKFSDTFQWLTECCLLIYLLCSSLGNFIQTFASRLLRPTIGLVKHSTTATTMSWSSCEGTLQLQQELLCNAVAAEYSQRTHTATPTCSSHSGIYRLITAYLLLRVNLDKIMHAR